MPQLCHLGGLPGPRRYFEINKRTYWEPPNIEEQSKYALMIPDIRNSELRRWYMGHSTTTTQFSLLYQISFSFMWAWRGSTLKVNLLKIHENSTTRSTSSVSLPVIRGVTSATSPKAAQGTVEQQQPERCQRCQCCERNRHVSPLGAEPNRFAGFHQWGIFKMLGLFQGKSWFMWLIYC